MSQGEPDFLRHQAKEEGQASLLNELASASVQGVVATGSRRGCKVRRFGQSDEAFEATVLGRRCAEVAGFNVHANTAVRTNERERLEQMVKYLARPPIANDRLEQLPDGLLALRLKTPWRDGTTHIVFTPHELIEKLIPLIPRPRSHVVRYHGILGPAAKDRDSVVPKARAVPRDEPNPGADGVREINPDCLPRSKRIPWALLLKRVFLVDVLVCPKCSGRMEVLAVVTGQDSVRRILKHLDLPTEAPRMHPARPPPQTKMAVPDDERFYRDPPCPDW